jgi:hypothetical protein
VEASKPTCIVVESATVTFAPAPVPTMTSCPQVLRTTRVNASASDAGAGKVTWTAAPGLPTNQRIWYAASEVSVNEPPTPPVSYLSWPTPGLLAKGPRFAKTERL